MSRRSLARVTCVLLACIFLPLPAAAQNAALVAAARKGDLAATKAAMSKGDDVNARGEGGLTPLMWASLYGHNNVVEALLAAGARVNDTDSEKGTALGYAAAAVQSDTVALLQRRGGTFELEGIGRFTWVMSRPTDIFDYIAKRGAESTAKAEAALKANWSAPLNAPADFRGKWSFDAGASDYGKSPKPRSATYTITQTAQAITTDVTVDGNQLVTKYVLTGAEAVNEMGPQMKTVTKARWDGSTLSTSSSLIAAAEERAALDDVWSLSPDGKTITIERHSTKPADTRLRIVLRKQ